MMTESEARTKWCPLARRHAFEGVASSAGNCPEIAPERRNDYAPCVGSDCMAWRWHRMPPLRRRRCPNRSAQTEEYAGQRPVEAAGWEFVPYNAHGEGEPAYWLEPEAQCRARGSGYCGAFGDPPDLVRRVEMTPPER